MSLYVKPRPWQEIAIEITSEQNLEKTIELARELTHAQETKEQPKNTTNRSAKHTTVSLERKGCHLHQHSRPIRTFNYWSGGVFIF